MFRDLPPGAVAAIICVLALATVLCIYSCSRDEKPVVLLQMSDLVASSPPFGDEELEISCSVYGEVRKPGIYRLRRGSRKYQVIDAAGGPTAQADLSEIRLFGELESGENIIVPARAKE